MITSSLRQYFTLDKAYSAEDKELINLSELIIDNYLPVFLNSSIFSKSYQLETVYTDITITDTDILTLNNQSTTYRKNMFQYGIVEVLSGKYLGLKIPVNESDDNVLSLNLSENISFSNIKIYQLGKFPIYGDFRNGFKTVPEVIRESVYLQFNYLKENKKFLNRIKYTSETQSTNSYSYNLGSGNSNLNNLQIAPKAKMLLDTSIYVQ